MIRENDTEAWGYIAGAVNDLDRRLGQMEEMIVELSRKVNNKKTPEEIARIRSENLAKARAKKKELGI